MATTPHCPHHIRNPRLQINRRGRWEIRFTRRTPAGDYVSDRVSTFTPSRAEAEDFLTGWLESEWAVAGQRKPAPAIIRVDALCEGYLTHIEARGKSASNRYVLVPVRRALGHHTADQLSETVLADYQTRRGVSDGTIRREFASLRAALFWAAKKKLIERTTLPEFEMPPESAPRDAHLERDQEQLLWDHAVAWGHADHQGHKQSQAAAWRVMLFVTLGLSTAARRGAIQQLTWSRVDLVHGNIDFRVPGERRTNKRKVSVPIADRLRPVLQEAAERAPQDATGRPTGRVLSVGDTRRAFAAFTRAIGMPWVTPHVLRHTWATLASRASVPEGEIAAMMGDDIATIHRVYVHYRPDYLRHAVNHHANRSQDQLIAEIDRLRVLLTAAGAAHNPNGVLSPP